MQCGENRQAVRLYRRNGRGLPYQCRGNIESTTAFGIEYLTEEQKIKEYVSSVEIHDRVKPEEIRRLLEDNGDMTAGVFLRKLKELKISGSDFLELLGNSKIGNMEFRRIEENPHLKFDELLQILDNSVLSGDDYRMIIAVATQRKELAEQRKRRKKHSAV